MPTHVVHKLGDVDLVEGFMAHPVDGILDVVVVHSLAELEAPEEADDEGLVDFVGEAVTEPLKGLATPGLHLRWDKIFWEKNRQK